MEEGYSNMVRYIDERLAKFKKNELPQHLSLLKSWENRLKEIEDWYRSNGEEVAKFADKIKEEKENHKNMTVDVISHDHSYCLRPCRKDNIIIPHSCDSKCVTKPGPLGNISPLEIPLHMGWQRVLMQRCGELTSLDAYYVTPCLRRLRTLDEVRSYLELTGTLELMGVNFTFDPLCSLIGVHYDPEREGAEVYIEDISRGKERIPISCVNIHSKELPDCLQEGFEYLTHRTYEPNIPHQQHAEFVVCCSCTDNCLNRSKCKCWQLTQEEAKLIGNTSYSAGYVHSRLKRQQHSAVYECNVHCHCKKEQCCNNVVQSGVKHRLQLFHTGSPQLKWGLRTLDDIPTGTFVCSYVGHVYTEMGAEKKALQHGDEYFAALDYIEVMECYKAGYEAEISIPFSSSDESSLSSSGRGSQPTSSGSPFTLSRQSSSLVTTPSDVIVISSDSEGEEEEEEEEREFIYCPPGKDSNSPPSPSPPAVPAPPLAPPPAPPSLPRTRNYYKEDFSYIIDAKSRGNMARYINHSCDPNLYVQNVFVDTHDLRFPWVAFIAKRRIKALEELTWDYNYEIGSVENKVIWCQCGAANCRKRLL